MTPTNYLSCSSCKHYKENCGYPNAYSCPNYTKVEDDSKMTDKRNYVYHSMNYQPGPDPAVIDKPISSFSDYRERSDTSMPTKMKNESADKSEYDKDLAEIKQMNLKIDEYEKSVVELQSDFVNFINRLYPTVESEYKPNEPYISVGKYAYKSSSNSGRNGIAFYAPKWFQDIPANYGDHWWTKEIQYNKIDNKRDLDKFKELLIKREKQKRMSKIKYYESLFKTKKSKRICNSCGEPLQKNAMFCFKCGCKIDR